jgi:outer membrane lipoprotein SlyB
MSQNPASAATTSGTLYDANIGSALRALVDRYGVSLIGESGRLRGLLQDECPQARREISVLLQALEDRVPQDLMRVHSGEPIASLSPRLAKRLSDEKAMSPQASRWAVATWAQGLGLESALGLGPDFVGGDDEPARTASPAGVGPIAANEVFLDTAPHLQSQGQGQGESPVPTPRRVPWWAVGVAAVVLAAGAWFGFLQPRLDIKAVEMQGAFVGDGKPRAVKLQVDARNSTLSEVEVRFVRGDGNWNAQPTRYPVAATASEIEAGTLAVQTAKPLHATFAYTLVGADGKRSAPFERTFEIVPPLVITGIDVPRPIKVGQNFAVAIKYQRSGADVVRVERHVVSSSTPWAQADAVQQLAAPDASGNVSYSFDAATKPMRSTVEFVLVDAQGVRSEPQRVALNVGTVDAPGTGPGTIVAIREVQTAGQQTGVGAVIGGVVGAVIGNTFGRGRGRVGTTVVGAAGGAYAGHEVEGRVRSGTSWNVTVHFDDGSTRTFTQAAAPRARQGDRVTVASGAAAVF